MDDRIFSPCNINVSMILCESTQKQCDTRHDFRNEQPASLETDIWYSGQNLKDLKTYLVSILELDLDQQEHKSF